MTFSSYFNVLWNEPRLHITEQFLNELNVSEGGDASEEKMIPGKQTKILPSLKNMFYYYYYYY